MPRPKRDMRQINAWLTAGQMAALEHIAETYEVTVSEALRAVLDAALTLSSVANRVDRAMSR